MTPKKKAKLSSPFKPHEWQEGYGIYENGFVEGAEWMLEEAADWIIDNVVFDKFGKSINIENFRKAMEE